MHHLMLQLQVIPSADGTAKFKRENQVDMTVQLTYSIIDISDILIRNDRAIYEA